MVVYGNIELVVFDLLCVPYNIDICYFYVCSDDMFFSYRMTLLDVLDLILVLPERGLDHDVVALVRE